MDCRYVLWDFDGTLADTSHDVWASLVYAAQRSGGVMEDSYMRDDANLADSMAEIIQHVHPYPGDAYLETFDEDVRVHYRTINDFSHTEFYPGIRLILDELLEQGIRNAIVTNKPERALTRVLGNKGWTDLFDDWICPDSTSGNETNKTDMIAQMLTKHGITPRQCLYVGDTFSDVEAARDNGVASIAVAYGDGDEMALLNSGPVYVARDVTQLHDIINDVVMRKGA
ncbi:HAD family hydrolase [Bifidobacterium imperatoris]|uniref:HAD family hydrolase n=1 Tax=Bifidobacterium imperatoris TaxID=2020965 RepID=A0A2N5ITZ4_9BIFI|nr:HAD family hydrolase [Bifidobacterium imperatoris]PLS25445.1 haloacid dehalogenase [Bifidobacterium imperatoris]QSY57025.1 HAD family hydrolase [Bifidobacterium imperatoris]